MIIFMTCGPTAGDSLGPLNTTKSPNGVNIRNVCIGQTCHGILELCPNLGMIYMPDGTHKCVLCFIDRRMRIFAYCMLRIDDEKALHYGGRPEQAVPFCFHVHRVMLFVGLMS